MDRNEELCDMQMEYAIGHYMQQGETRESLLEKFSGDKGALVRWLRERGAATEALSEKPAQQKKSHAFSPAPKRKKSTKSENTSGNAATLF